MKLKNNIHKTAIIDSNVKIGKNTKIWHWSHLCKNVIIGTNVTIGQNVFIGENVTIGSNVKIQNNVSIFEGVQLENFVFCGPGVTFTNVLYPRSEFPVQNKIKEYEKTLVKKSVTIGANSTIICGNTINSYAFIGAGSVVTKDVKSYSLVAGVPAKHKGWVSRSGSKLKFSSKLRVAKCKTTTEKYKLIKNKCILIK
tara:strand:- start:1336 stop:1926 length:591 start_codon:yes stop_codon:yes gene_type:complete